MERALEVIKKAGLTAIQSAILLLLLCGHLWLMYTNFTALKVSFELARYDGTPVGDDLLTGPLWEALGMYDLTQAHMFAAAIAFFVGILSFLAFRHAYLAIQLLIERREYKRTGNMELVEQADNAIIRNLATLSLIMLPLIPVAYWDMQLFRYRSAASAMEMEANAVAMKDWPLLIQQHGDLFTISLARFGGWAYIFLVCGASLAVEVMLTYIKESLARLNAAFKAWQESLAGNAEETATIAVENQNIQIPEQPAAVNTRVAAQEHANATTGNDTPNEQPADGAAGNINTGSERVERPEKPRVGPQYTANTPDPQGEDREVLVYGGAQGERIKFSTAAANPENYYIDEARRVWRRDFANYSNATEPAEAVA